MSFVVDPADLLVAFLSSTGHHDGQSSATPRAILP